MRTNEPFAIQRKKLLLRLIVAAVFAGSLFGVLALTASARTTYRINDGGRVMYHTTYATDPAEVLDEAGLVLGIDDTYTTQESGGYPGIIVQRIQMVTVDNGGQILKTGTYGETVEELLARMNITLDQDDELSVELSDKTYDGMEIHIRLKNTILETYSKALPFETEYVEDSSLSVGTERTLTAGQEGEMVCTDQVNYENGQEVSRSLISSEITREPVNAIVARGTAESQEISLGEVTIGNGVITTASGDVLTYTHSIQTVATAYCTQGITATGTVARVGEIAVDPSVIPYGTRMFIVSNDGQYIYGVATAEDTGHPDYISGNRIDLFMNTQYECQQFGVRNCTVYILG